MQILPCLQKAINWQQPTTPTCNFQSVGGWVTNIENHIDKHNNLTHCKMTPVPRGLRSTQNGWAPGHAPDCLSLWLHFFIGKLKCLASVRRLSLKVILALLTNQVLLRHNSMLPRKIIWSLINRFWHFKVKHCFIHTLFRQLKLVGTDVPVRIVWTGTHCNIILNYKWKHCFLLKQITLLLASGYLLNWIWGVPSGKKGKYTLDKEKGQIPHLSCEIIHLNAGCEKKNKTSYIQGKVQCE